MSRDTVLFLVQLSAVLNKSRAYPPGHPMLTASLDILATQLFGLLKGRPGFLIGISRYTLVVDGAETDPGHAVLRDLADRIHRHQLATIELRPGVGEDELGDLLMALAQETWRQGKPLGLESADVLAERWPHITVEPIPLHQLELGDDDTLGGATARRAEELWQGLVHAAMLFNLNEEGEGEGTGQPPSAGRPGGGRAASPVSGADAARAIRARKGDASYSQAIVDWMAQLGDHLGDAGRESPAHQRVSDLFGALDQETLQQLLTLGATIEKRREIVFRGARALPVKAVLDLLQATAKTSDRNISHSLLKILAKLASHLESGRGPIVPGAEDVLRDSVRQLVGNWDNDADAAPHRQLLDLLSRPVGATGVQTGKASPGALRLAQLGLELQADTPAITVAFRNLAAAGELALLMGLRAEARAKGLDTSRLEEALYDPTYVRDWLLDEGTDADALTILIEGLGDEAAAPLLEALESAESATRRRFLLQRLERFGPRLGPLLVARLPDKPWFVQRNLLSLLATLPDQPAGFNAGEYADHDNPRVRREAYKLQFAEPSQRGKAILAAASDPDEGIVLLALGAASENCPPELVPRLIALLDGPYRAPEMRSSAIRLLGTRPSTSARTWLMAQVVTTTGWLWFKRETLRTKSQDMLTALTVLARAYSGQAGVASVLRLAAAHQDPEIRHAVRQREP
ncbi:MAG TPA: hypothetical protein VMK53_08795 [Gemmatimonadales bacterium]|nr:hypothetical protein [Gemmatimonadales bacterium]